MSAIDFQALLIEERKRLRAERANAANAAAAPSAEIAAAPAQQPACLPLDVHYELPARCGRPTLRQEHRVNCGLDFIQHIPEWCTPEEEQELLRCVDGADSRRWTMLRGRRLQSLGGVPRAPPEMMSREPLPTWVQSVCDALVACGAFPADKPPNHVLLNEYQPGQGIDAHKDGPIYAPYVAILSLNSTAAFEFLEEIDSTDDSVAAPSRVAVARLLLPPRGVLIFSGEAYEHKLHRVPARHDDDLQQPGLVRLDSELTDGTAIAAARCLPRSRRVSLTVRHVLHSTGGDNAAARDKAAPPPAMPLPAQRYEVAKLSGPNERSPQCSPSVPRCAAAEADEATQHAARSASHASDEAGRAPSKHHAVVDLHTTASCSSADRAASSPQSLSIS